MEGGGRYRSSGAGREDGAWKGRREGGREGGRRKV